MPRMPEWLCAGKLERSTIVCRSIEDAERIASANGGRVCHRGGTPIVVVDKYLALVWEAAPFGFRSMERLREFCNAEGWHAYHVMHGSNPLGCVKAAMANPDLSNRLNLDGTDY